MKRSRSLRCESLEDRRLLNADPVPFIDLNATPIPGEVEEMIQLGDTLYFVNDGLGVGRELWKTDGTEAGTELVKDITPGDDYFSISELTQSGGLLYFVANDGVHGHELWRSDGTEAGTWMVKDIRLENDNCFSESQCWDRPQRLTDVGGTVYFVAPDADNLYGLWKSDGTTAGTTKVLDTGSNTAYELTGSDDMLYFLFQGKLWSSDATTTEKVHDDLRVSAIAVGIDGQLYLSGRLPGNGDELWKSDGTEAGTSIIKEIRPGTAASSPRSLTPSTSGLIYFTAIDGLHGRELWRTDGTEAGTFMLKDVRPGGDSPFGGGNSEIVDIQGSVFFRAIEPANQAKLWKTDGTEAGTTQVSNANLNATSLTAVGGSLFFLTLSSINNDGVDQLWTSDGTESGTVMLREFTGDLRGAENLHDLNGSLYFSATDQEHGAEVWTSDGTSSGTVRVTDIDQKTERSLHGASQVIDDALYFDATDGSNSGLWKTDGTEYGTEFLSSVGGHGASSIVQIDSTIFVTAYDKLWKTDGTAAGTTLVKDFGHTYGLSNLVAAGDRLFFITQGRLWQSDGTFAGTTMVSNQTVSDDIAAIGDRVVYYSSRGLWITDGSQHTLLQPGLTQPAFEFVSFQDSLYFVSRDDVNGDAIWRTDGTPEGTVVVDSSTSFYRHLTVVGDELFFMSRLGSGTYGLWKTDGTEQGKTMVKDVGGWQIQQFTDGNGHLMFVQDGRFLWRSDGTEEGTRIVREFDQYGPVLVDLAFVDGWFYFIGSEQFGQDELWRSDGTTVGTEMLTNAFPDVETPRQINDHLIHVGDTESYGVELHLLDSNPNTLVSAWDFETSTPSDGAIAGSLDDQATFTNVEFELGGINEQSLLFADPNAIVSYETSSDINIGRVQQKSISLWFLPTDSNANGQQMIYEQGGSTRGLNIYLDNGELLAGAWDSISGWDGSWVSTSEFNANQWNHVALTFSETAGRIQLFVNGNLVGTEAAYRQNGHLAANLGNVKQGTRFAPGDVGYNGPADFAYKGYIDELRIYQSELSRGEVDHLVGSYPVEPIGLWNQVAHWDFDGDAADRAMEGLYSDDGTVSGATIESEVGIGDNAVLFDEPGDIVSFDSSPDINEGNITEKTISLWFAVDDFYADSRHFLYEQGGTERGLNIYLENGQLYAGGWNISKNWDGNWISTYVSLIQQWNHVVLTFDANEGVMRLYLNGELRGEAEAFQMSQHNAANIGGVRHGSRIDDGNGGFVRTTSQDTFRGYIDDARVFNSALAADEVSLLYRSQRPIQPQF